MQNVVKSIKTSPSIVKSEAKNLRPMGNSFMYIETSSCNFGFDNVFCSSEQTDVIQNCIITFYYNRFSSRIIKSLSHFTASK